MNIINLLINLINKSMHIINLLINLINKSMNIINLLINLINNLINNCEGRTRFKDFDMIIVI